MASSRIAGLGLIIACVAGYLAIGPQLTNEHGTRIEQHTDVHGDILPARAVARLGTVRWRHYAQTCAFSPDGKYFVTAWQQPRVYEAKSGRFLSTIDVATGNLHFLPDSQTLVTSTVVYSVRGDPSWNIRLWDAATGRQRRQFFVAGRPASWAGRFLATITNDAHKGDGVSVWDLETGNNVANPPMPIRGIFFVSLAPRGKTLALRYQKRLFLLDASTGKELWSLPVTIAGSMLFTPDSSTLIFADSGSVSLLDVATAKIKRQIPIPENSIGSLTISADGQRLAIAAGPVSIWDLSTGNLVRTIRLSMLHGMSLFTLSAKGETLLAQQSLSHVIRRWDVTSGQELTLADPVDPVMRVAFSSDSATVVARYTGRMVDPGTTRQDFVLWSLATMQPSLYEERFNHKQIHHFLAQENLISPNHFSAPWGPGYPTCSPDGKTFPVIYSGEEKPELRRPTRSVHWTKIGFWDVRLEKITRSFRVNVDLVVNYELLPKNHAHGVHDLALSPDRTLLAAIVGYNSILVWDLATGQEVQRLDFPGYPGPQCNAIAFSSDGRKLISSHFQWRTKTNTLYVHDLATGEELSKADCAIEIPHLRCGPVFANDRLAALAVGKDVYLVDPLTGRTLGSFRGHLEPITCLAFSPDRKLLATGSFDTTILVWDVSRLLAFR